MAVCVYMMLRNLSDKFDPFPALCFPALYSFCIEHFVIKLEGKDNAKSRSRIYGGIAKGKATVTFEEISGSLDGFCHDYSSVLLKDESLTGLGKGSEHLRFSTAAPFAVQPSQDPDVLQLVYCNKDELHAVALIRRGAWSERAAITVCTRYPEDLMDNWTWDTFTISWNQRDGWTGISDSNDALSDLSKDSRDAVQNYLNQIMTRVTLSD